MSAFCTCDTTEQHPASECVAPWDTEQDMQQRDVRALLVALGLGDHARPYSPHAVIHRDVMPAIERLRGAGREQRGGEQVNDAARDAATSVAYIEMARLDGTSATAREVADAVLTAALPHLTVEDVPHIAAQAIRDAADEYQRYSDDTFWRDDSPFHAAQRHAGRRFAEWLRDQGDRLDPKDGA